MLVLKLKKGVDLTGVKPEILASWPIVAAVYYGCGEAECTVTSVCDGVHTTIVHSLGMATDFRLPASCPPEVVVERMREALNKQYDVVLQVDHIHVEFDPR